MWKQLSHFPTPFAHNCNGSRLPERASVCAGTHTMYNNDDWHTHLRFFTAALLPSLEHAAADHCSPLPPNFQTFTPRSPQHTPPSNAPSRSPPRRRCRNDLHRCNGCAIMLWNPRGFILTRTLTPLSSHPPPCPRGHHHRMGAASQAVCPGSVAPLASSPFCLIKPR